MQILIIRHAPAEDREKFAHTNQPDELRPLTNKGKAKMRQNIQGLLHLIPQIDCITTSPLIRTTQTAGLLASAYPNAQRKTLAALAPTGSKSAILAYLQKMAKTIQTIALVGHEPDLRELTTWLLSKQLDNWIFLKKGGACLLEFIDDVEAGEAELGWMLKSKHLRQLAESKSSLTS